MLAALFKHNDVTKTELAFEYQKFIAEKVYIVDEVLRLKSLPGCRR